MKKVIDTLCKCAKYYHDNLLNKNLIFVSAVGNKINFIETEFLVGNFAHLTGVQYGDATKFFKKCLAHKLSINDFKIKTNGTTLLKLQVLPQIMDISKNVSMIGNFDHTKRLLNTDKITGNITACLGFIKGDNSVYYAPNTVLKGDIKNNISNCERVIAVFSKPINSSLYNTLEYAVTTGTFNLKSISSLVVPKQQLNFNFPLPNGFLNNNPIMQGL